MAGDGRGNAVAVGQDDPDNTHFVTLIEQVEGSAFTRETSPDPAANDGLLGISQTSGLYLAVGFRQDPSAEHTLVEFKC